MKFRLGLAIVLLAASTAAWGQGAVLQGGAWTQGHIPQYSVNGSSQAVIQDGGGAGGGAAGGNPFELGVTARGVGTPPYVGQGTGPLGTNICDYDAPITNAAGYHYLCFSANAAGGGLLTYGAAGSATALPLSFVVNGVTYPFPFSGGGGGNLIIGSTPVSGATAGQILYSDGTLLQAKSVTGSGNIVEATNPTIAGEIVSGTANFTGGAGNFQIGGNAMAFPGIPATLAYVVASTPGNCVTWSNTTGLGDAGAACGSGGGGSSSTANRQDFCTSGTSGCTSFYNPGDSSITLGSIPVADNAVTIAFDGVIQSGNTWTRSSNTINFNAPIPACSAPSGHCVIDVSWLSAAVGIGTVTSVGFTDASNTPIFAIAGTPITNSGVLTQTLHTQTANIVFAGPQSGGAAQPGFRALVGTDLPNPGASSKGGIQSITSLGSNWIAYIDTSGVPHQSQPTYTDLAAGAPTATTAVLGLVKGDNSTLAISGPGVISCVTMTSSQIGCAKVDGTTITISGGAISAVGSSLTVGSSIVGSCTSGYIVYSNSGVVGCELLAGGGNVSASGTPTINQLAIWTNATTIQGVTALPAANFPALTGDVTTSAGSLATTVAKIGGNTVSLGGTLTTGGNVTFSGAHNFTGTLTADTSVTFPTSGMLVNSGVATLSSLTSIGTIATGTWQGTIVGATYGGTGVNNGSNTLTLGGALTTTGAATPTLAFGTGSWTYTMAATANDTVALLSKRDQAMTGGVTTASYSIGTVSSGTTTIDCGNSPVQYLTNGGAFTLANPANASTCLVMLINNASAGTITFSGFTSEASHGDALDTTNGHQFTLSIWRINGVSDYRVAAMQ